MPSWLLPDGFWQEVGPRAAWAMFLESHGTLGVRYGVIHERGERAVRAQTEAGDARF